MSRGLNSSISTAGVLCRDLKYAPGEKSTMCQKLSERVMSRAKKTAVEGFFDQDETEIRTIMLGCLGTRGLLQNKFRIDLLNVLNPYPVILLRRLGYAAPNPPPPLTGQGHLRRGAESSLHRPPAVPPTEFK